MRTISKHPMSLGPHAARRLYDAKKFTDLAATIPSERRAALDREIVKTVARMRVRELREALKSGNPLPSSAPSTTDKES